MESYNTLNSPIFKYSPFRKLEIETRDGYSGSEDEMERESESECVCLRERERERER